MTTFLGLLLGAVLAGSAFVPYDLKPSPIGPDTGSTMMAAEPVIYLLASPPDSVSAPADTLTTDSTSKKDTASGAD